MDTEKIKEQVSTISKQNYETFRDEGLDYAQLEEIRLGLESGIDISSYADSDIPWFQMEEIRLGLEHGIDIRRYLQEGFDWMQLSEIRLGIEHGVDISTYAKQEYLSQQMYEIRVGLENKIDVSRYLNPSYDWFQMEEIRKGLERGDNIEVYANERYDSMTMRQIRKAMEKGIDLLPYVEKGYGAELLIQIRRCLAEKLEPEEFLEKGYNAAQLEQIRTAFEKKIVIAPYLSADMTGNQLEEIIKGMEVGIEVSVYAKSKFSWQQMRELRLGLENRINAASYSDPLFSWQQMQEIRLGLQSGYDVSGYAEVKYSAAEMRKLRENLMQDEENESLLSANLVNADFAPSFVTISDDGMEAVLDLAVPDGNRKYTEQDILDILKAQGVTLGIDRDIINAILTQELYGRKIVVARGQKAVPGSDGQYEFLFKTELPTKPKILEDGSVDYMHMEYFEQVKQGQKLAVYVPATLGKGGYTVSGKIMVARKGKEKPVLRGEGFTLAEDKCTYLSKLNGKVEIQGYRMLVSKLHVIDGDVTYTTGNISFEGDLIVKGCVRSGVTLQAGGNLEIEGNVESANLISNGDILVKEGVQAGGVGFIRAKGAVTGKFFESVKIEAEQDIRANYILNCDIATKRKVIVSGRKGILAGGVTRAIQGIEVFDIGNAAQLGTTVEIGLTKKFFEQYNEIEKSIIKAQSETKVFKEGLQKFEKTYTSEQLAEIFVYDKIKMAYEMKTEELEESLAKKAKLEEEMDRMSQAKVVVKGKAYAGTHIIIDRIPLRLTESVPNVTFRHIEDRVAIFRN